ncbi:hypothetical protein HYALB_00010817 [Hymenoscyphus albidus]|uniref:non-specific serine/threonine protein kinase n=1 Tax=Hymenoscyphus albidus TaxID=595503 RepID=A0A9N9LQ93_9HELO|nr:hypothetical protein HYALB_00010817 [Hymenoscyphus albidus]
MSSQLPSRPPSRRPPLGEATRRVNNAQQADPTSSPMPHHESLKPDGLLQVRNPLSQGECYPSNSQHAASPGSNVANPRLSAISKETPTESASNRNSQISTVSTNASDGKRLKQTIGPWKLGKTLGKGATARVRLARHAHTGQEAAIKIVQKKNAQMSQAGSLAALDRAEAGLPDCEDGLRRMPVGLEREVAIMKLIQHPNIIKLYDIWENRTEIYLVLEFVDNGELFEHIVAKGRLSEEEAMKYFRRILSAVGYCHSFNICHRDLKPENILLTRDGNIKIADFGMAALHQHPDHKLKTSCGSPHYAAPELIRGANYKGDKVDIWSMGVILYASLAGRLPFDVEGSGRDWLGPLLSKIRKGNYEMAPEFSDDAVSLIYRILQVDPRTRISLNQIWRHPLVRKYDYLDNLARGNNSQSPSAKDCGRPVMRRSDINKELLRHMRSLWHRFTEAQLVEALLSEESNDQKLFYTLLLKYRERQLENYTPDLGYSTSDYHHIRPPTMSKSYSTLNFSQPKLKGHGRQVSSFTVISNAAETERSYDPFKASRPQHLDSNRRTERARITIHRDPDVVEDKALQKPRVTSRVSINSSALRSRQGLAPPKVCVSRSSLASSSRSRGSAPYVRATVGRRRGVSFTHNRKPSGDSHSQLNTTPGTKKTRNLENHDIDVEATEDSGDSARPIATGSSARYIRSRKGNVAISQQSIPALKNGRTNPLWTDDVRQLSSSLAKDCDEAFNRTNVGATSKPSAKDLRPSSLESRPLPAPPSRSESVKIELLEYRKQAELRKSSGDDSPSHLDRMVSHIDRLIGPDLEAYSQRRTSSAPVEGKNRPPSRPLPSIHEARGEDGNSPRRASDSKTIRERARLPEQKNGRIASAPEPRTSNKNHTDDRFLKPGSQVRDTIHVVQPSSPRSPVKALGPLTIRKKSSRGGAVPMMSGGLNSEHDSKTNRYRASAFELRQQYNADVDAKTTRYRASGVELRQQYHLGARADITPELELIEEDRDHDYEDHLGHESSTGTVIRKKSSWFKRNSRSGDMEAKSNSTSDLMPSQSSHNEMAEDHRDALPPMPTKSKGFSLRRLFKKRSKPDMTVAPYDIYDDNACMQDSIVEAQRQSHAGRSANHDDPRARQIEPQQNWLAKLFHVKPQSKFICFSVSKRRARQEITTVLKEWRRYGIRDIQVDKERNIVFGKVGARNFLDMKEVAFAGEVMTVIEYGKRSHLSIVRFTQERGAASSFQKVVETLESVLKCRGMLLGDERKKRMMIKTLNAL